MAAKKPSWSDVKHVISHWSDEQLRGLVQGMYHLKAGNTDFLHNTQLLPEIDDEQLLDPCRQSMMRSIERPLSLLTNNGNHV